MSKLEFKFLKEKPLETVEEISNSKFGHEEIATTLANVSEKCPTPFTIGLLARWGSGKSTIANSLKKKLLPKNIPVVLFDVWKHEGDALRRTFLKELVKQLKGKDYGDRFFPKDFKLNDRLEKSVTTNSNTKLRINYELLGQLKPWFIFLLIILVIISVVLHHFHVLNDMWNLIKPLILTFAGVTGGGAFVIWLLKQSVYFFSSETTNYGVDKFEDPHEFEEEFACILKVLKNQRIVIVFDNLDRVTHDKVAEVLSTIKTFLEPSDLNNTEKEVVFLVPCDAQSIKHHLANVYGSTDKFTFDSDEFLRKFFNTIIWIPDFIPVELESLAKDSLHATNIPVLDNNYVAWLITKAFRDNPRQIIQFVNILLANYLLVHERQGDGKDFPSNFLSENISQLTKYLILNQLFPDETEVLRKKKVLNLTSGEAQQAGLTQATNGLFLKFIEETKDTPITNLRIFFTLRRSDQEKKFPGFESFVTLLEDRKKEEANAYIAKVADFQDSVIASDFAQAIKTEIESKTNPVSTANLIDTLFTIIDETKITLSGPLFQEISNKLNGGCKEHLHLVSPESLNNVLFSLYSSDRSSLITQWIDTIEGMHANDARYPTNPSFIEQVFSVITDHPEYLTAEQSEKIQHILYSHYSKDLKFANMLVKSKKAQEKVGSSQYSTNFLEALSGGQIPEIIERIQLLGKLDSSLIKPVGPDNVIKKFSEIQTNENKKTDEPIIEKQKLANTLNEFIQNNLQWIKEASEEVKVNLIDALIAGFSNLPNIEEKSALVPALVGARKYASESKLPEIESILSGYVSSVSPENFQQTYLSLPDEEKATFFEGVLLESAENRSINDEKFRDEFFNKITDQQKKIFVEKIFQQNIEGAFQFVESIDKKENKNIFPIFDNIWSVYDSSSVQNKKRMFDFVNSRNANEDSHVRDVLAAKITTCLTSTDLSLQEVGLQGLSGASKHLAQSRIRQVIKDIFDWVRKPEISPKYQPFALRAILSEYQQFNDQEKAEFVQFVFEELMRKSNDIVDINFGFETLDQLNVKYEDRIQNFDDIKLRIENEDNPDIKKTLVDGLGKLKPSRTNSENKEFWGLIDELIQEESE